MKLDFIKEHNAFGLYAESRGLSANAQLLWYRLFDLYNRACYPCKLFVSDMRLASL